MKRKRWSDGGGGSADSEFQRSSKAWMAVWFVSWLFLAMGYIMIDPESVMSRWEVWSMGWEGVVCWLGYIILVERRL